MPDWNDSHTKALKGLLGKDAVLTDVVTLLAYESDALGFQRHRPDCVVLPPDLDALAATIRWCADQGFPYVVRGAGTSLSGGPTALYGGLVISTAKLNRVLEIHPEDLYCVVEPGAVLNQVGDALAPHGLFYPPDASSGFACTLGGNVAENAGGIRCAKYGVTANYVLGLEAIMLDGSVQRFGGPAGGPGPGFTRDWAALVCGSEGTLATIGRIWLRVLPLPEKIWTFMTGFRRLEDICAAVLDLIRYPGIPVALEFTDNRVIRLVENSRFAVGFDPDSWVLFTEIDGPAALVDRQVAAVEAILRRHDPVLERKSDDAAERLAMWKARKVVGGLMGQLKPAKMVQDAVIPRPRLAEVLRFIYAAGDQVGLPVLVFFHAGDGNLHPNILFDMSIDGDLERMHEFSELFLEKVREVGGMPSGEHGIGLDKRDFIPLFFSAAEMGLHQAVAVTFNPTHRLNPGKLLPGRDLVPTGEGR